MDITLYLRWRVAARDRERAFGLQASSVREAAPAEAAWRPVVEFYDLYDARTLTEESYYTKNDERKATINYICPICTNFPLEHFPFDRQVLRVLFLLNAPTNARLVAVKSGLRSEAWRLDAVVPSDATPLASADPPGIKFDFFVTVTRVPQRYIFNHVVIFFALGLCAVASFALPRNDLRSRSGMVITLLLVTVTAKLTVSQYVPPSERLTLLDKYVLATFYLQLLVIAEHVLVATSFKHHRKVAARIDTTFATVYLAFWVGSHVVLAYLIRAERLVPSQKHAYKAFLQHYKRQRVEYKPPQSQGAAAPSPTVRAQSSEATYGSVES